MKNGVVRCEGDDGGLRSVFLFNFYDAENGVSFSQRIGQVSHLLQKAIENQVMGRKFSITGTGRFTVFFSFQYRLRNGHSYKFRYTPVKFPCKLFTHKRIIPGTNAAVCVSSGKENVGGIVSFLL